MKTPQIYIFLACFIVFGIHGLSAEQEIFNKISLGATSYLGFREKMVHEDSKKNQTVPHTSGMIPWMGGVDKYTFDVVVVRKDATAILDSVELTLPGGTKPGAEPLFQLFAANESGGEYTYVYKAKNKVYLSQFSNGVNGILKKTVDQALSEQSLWCKGAEILGKGDSIQVRLLGNNKSVAQLFRKSSESRFVEVTQ